jgi:hypothetical protein
MEMDRPRAQFVDGCKGEESTILLIVKRAFRTKKGLMRVGWGIEPSSGVSGNPSGTVLPLGLSGREVRHASGSLS